MNTEPDSHRPFPAECDERQLQAWIALRDQMQELHAQLEYMRLMLALQKRAG